MLRLTTLEVCGFGPFAEPQTIVFPKTGVTVVYGENMRGKTSLLNAIRFAFFGVVVGRGARERRRLTVSNRDNASRGEYGFRVRLGFEFEGIDYELAREVKPLAAAPASDSDFSETTLLRRGDAVLGPQERETALQHIFPNETSRFFLFDGELLQEYEELVSNDSDSGRRISDAIERILGVPILKRARAHLGQLADAADKVAAKEASMLTQTRAQGAALQTATEQRDAHQGELHRKQLELAELLSRRQEVERGLHSQQRYTSLLEERDRLDSEIADTDREICAAFVNLRECMSEAWRTLLLEPLRAARTVLQGRAEREIQTLTLSLRAEAISQRRCGVCSQTVSPDLAAQLQPDVPTDVATGYASGFQALAQLAEINRFHERDVAEAVRQVWCRIEQMQVRQAVSRDRLSELTSALSDADPQTIRRKRGEYSEIAEQTVAVRRAIEDHERKISELDASIYRLRDLLEKGGIRNLAAGQRRARTLRAAAEVFDKAVGEYKQRLRSRVEATATKLFRVMTTETEDYDGLSINESFGLTIRHTDGKAEEARSAGAEHVVALALMGALQQNAPLRGPIVMDSPFGRLDHEHTTNVVRALPDLASQVVLLVYESEVGRDEIRRALRQHLVREYELERQTARRTTIREVR